MAARLPACQSGTRHPDTWHSTDPDEQAEARGVCLACPQRGLRPAPGQKFVGGLWVLGAASRDDVVALIENDPYYQPEHRNYRVLAWGKALDGPVTL